MAGISRFGAAAPSLARRFGGMLAATLRFGGMLAATRRQAYGSASAAQLQYDYYDYEDVEEEEWGRRDRRGPRLAVDSEGWVPPRGVQWVVIGDRSAKKHVYAERLSKLLEVPHISMGTLVRQELNPCSSLYKQIANAVNDGKLVPEDIIFALLSKRLDEGYYRGESGFILDGIPRTRMQAEILDEMADIDMVVNFKGSEELLDNKSLGTGNLSAGCNLNLVTQDERQRSSLTESDGLWKEKINVYTEQSKALEDYYRKQRKLVDFQVTGGPGETWQGLLAALHLQHINAVSSSQKLTA